MTADRKLKRDCADRVLYCWSMDKRLAKRHMRQVDRAQPHSTTSEPDVRTHEQIEAAREAIRPVPGYPAEHFPSSFGRSDRSSPAPKNVPKDWKANSTLTLQARLAVSLEYSFEIVAGHFRASLHRQEENPHV